MGVIKVNKKGLELPMNTLVVLVILIIVLAVMVIWFISGSSQGNQSTDCQMKWSSACSKFSMAGGCKDGQVNSDKMTDVDINNYFGDLPEGCYPSASAAAEACCG